MCQGETFEKRHFNTGIVCTIYCHHTEETPPSHHINTITPHQHHHHSSPINTTFTPHQHHHHIDMTTPRSLTSSPCRCRCRASRARPRSTFGNMWRMCVNSTNPGRTDGQQSAGALQKYMNIRHKTPNFNTSIHQNIPTRSNTDRHHIQYLRFACTNHGDHTGPSIEPRVKDGEERQQQHEKCRQH